MNWTVPKSWRKVSREEFEQAVEVTSYYRDNWGDADVYLEGWNNHPFAAKVFHKPKRPTYYLEK